jgi:hypothetical protein
MAFDANKQIKIEASQSADETFRLRTKGLAAQRRAELEIAGVPEPALRAAAGILNHAADHTVTRVELLADQTFGFTLTSDDGAEPLMLAARTVQCEPASDGLWNKLTGRGKGVLRLVDPGDATGDTPLTALATMLVHRAALRTANDDHAGARKELEAAIAAFPGALAEVAGEAPSLGEAEGVYNWQNHRAYLALAELEGPDEQGAFFFAEALRRSGELSVTELGATLAEISAVDEPTARGEATRIIDTNFATFERSEGPTPDLVIVPSPVWETTLPRTKTAGAFRRASLVPAKLVELYYEGIAATGVQQSGAALAAAAFIAARKSPSKLAWKLRSQRNVWSGSGPVACTHPHHPACTLLSVLLVEVARCFRAGATEAEIRKHLAGRPPAALAAKLSNLEQWEADQYMTAMSV